jgi:nucleoid-associated protein YgaU
MRLAAFCFIVVYALPAVAGQPPAAPAPTPATDAPAPAATPQPPTPVAPAAGPEAETYTYQIEGRRDPFLNLLGTVDTRGLTQRPEGVAGLQTAELSVRGVVQTSGAFIAMVQGPDNRTHIVRQGDKLMDGLVKAVTAEGLVIVQDVNDPLSLIKQREVRRLLRTLEAAKE